MKTILVTGGCGYIGSILVPMLLKNNYKVKVVDRFFFGKNLRKNKNLTLLFGDVRSLNKKIFKNIYAIIDLAALSNDPSGEYYKRETYEINFKSRFNSATLAKKYGVRRYILPSSCSVYGFNQQKVKETSQTNPLTTYAKCNLMAERKILKLSSKNFCVTVLRFSTVFGFSPRMRYDLALNGMIESSFVRKVLPIMRDGKQYRPLVHVKDCARSIIFFLRKEIDIINGEVFNIGSDNCTVTIHQLANIIKKSVKNLKINWYGSPDNRSYKVDFSKSKKLGFVAKHNLDFGIREIIKKLKSNKDNAKKTINITLDWYKLLEQMTPTILSCQLKSKIIKFKK